MKAAILRDRTRPDASLDEIDTLKQARYVGQALRALGCPSEVIEFDLGLGAVREALRKSQPDFVFNLVEAVEDEGQLIYLAPALLETMGIPYTGAGLEAMQLTSNKTLAKRLLRSAGIDTPPWIEIEAAEDTGFDPAQPHLFKSRWEHGSIGVSEQGVRPGAGGGIGEVRAALKDAAQGMRGGCFAEQFIDGREFNLALLAGESGPEVLPPSEIVFVDYPPDKPRVVGYAAKWEAESFEYTHTPRRYRFPADDARLLERLAEMALRCWSLFRLRGYARVDFRVDPGGRPWVLEANANPCLSADAGFAVTLARAKVPFAEAVRRIVRDSLGTGIFATPWQGRNAPAKAPNEAQPPSIDCV